MALPNNPTQAQVVKAIKDLENAPAQSTDVQVNGTSITSGGVANIVTESAYNASTNKIATKNDIPTKTSDLTNDSGFLTAAPTNMVTTDTAQTVSGTKTLTGGLKVSGRSVGSGDDEGIVVGVAANNYAGVCCGSPSGRRAVFYLKPSATSGNSVWRYNNGSTTYDIAHPEKAGTIALTSDIPSAVTESTVSGWGFTKNAGTITGVQLNGTTVASSGVANVQALPNFSLNISHQTAGNPRQVKFLTVDYNTKATYFKMSATSCHDNGTSYQFLEDIIIGCTTGGTVVCNVYKYCQQAVTLDSVARNYGDVFYVIDTTNKKVDFFILCGQYASSQFTPATKIGNTTIAYITQYTETATYYSSGTKVWASGDSTTYARLSDIPTSYVSSVNGQTGAVTVGTMPFTLTHVATYTTATALTNLYNTYGKNVTICLVPYRPDGSGLSNMSLMSTSSTSGNTFYTHEILFGKLGYGSGGAYFGYYYRTDDAGENRKTLFEVKYLSNCKVYTVTYGS